MDDNGIGDLVGLFGAREGAHGSSLLAIGKSILEGSFHSSQTLYCSTETRGVDESEHLSHPLVRNSNDLPNSVCMNDCKLQNKREAESQNKKAKQKNTGKRKKRMEKNITFKIDLASRRAVASHLVLDATNSSAIEFAGQGPVILNLELGDSKEGDTLDALGCIG